jgi:5'-3' exonuclease
MHACNIRINAHMHAYIQVDMEFKKNDWEGVALIPFIDAALLVAEHDKVSTDTLSPDEILRNKHGNQRVFIYDNTVEDTIPSPMHGLPALTHCHTRCEEYIWPDFPMHTGGRFLPVLCDGVEMGENATAGFPSILSREITHDIRNARVNVFGRPSARESVVVCLSVKNDVDSEGVVVASRADDVQHLVGKRFFADWPYLRECMVKAVSDKTCRYIHTYIHTHTHIYIHT